MPLFNHGQQAQTPAHLQGFTLPNDCQLSMTLELAEASPLIGQAMELALDLPSPEPRPACAEVQSKVRKKIQLDEAARSGSVSAHLVCMCDCVQFKCDA
jgi:hypothetical protein